MIDFNKLPCQDKIYYKDDSAVIYCADCREILPLIPDKSIDLVLTDPPYGVGGLHGTINTQRAKSQYHSNFRDDREYIISVVIPIVKELLKVVSCVVLTPGNINCCSYPQPSSIGVFYQPASVGLQTFGNADANLIFYYGKNRRHNMGVPCSYQLTEPPSSKHHPCSKPEKAWTKLLSNISLPNDLVLDPFLGSGTTAYCAKKLGRKCIGIEIEEKYCKIAVDRLRQSVLRLE